jgi:hypothetical protein
MLDIGGALSYFIFSLVFPLIFSLSFVVAIWGAFQYFIAGFHDEEAREKGKSLIMYGLLLFGGMILVWGILRIIINAFA